MLYVLRLTGVTLLIESLILVIPSVCRIDD